MTPKTMACSDSSWVQSHEGSLATHHLLASKRLAIPERESFVGFGGSRKYHGGGQFLQ